MNQIEIRVPDIGDAKDVEVIEILVAVGDMIEADQSLITLESDKSSMEIPASQGGLIKSIHVSIGHKVSEGSLILMLEVGTEPNLKDELTAADQEKQITNKLVACDQGSDSEGRRASGMITIAVPDIGDFAEAEVIELLVAEGESIHAEQGLISIETDKASMEIPAPTAGIVKLVLIKVGDKVSKGTQLMEVESNATLVDDHLTSRMVTDNPTVALMPATANIPKTEASKAAIQQQQSVTNDSNLAFAQVLQNDGFLVSKLPHASPSVRKFARELGANLSCIQGSGPKARITINDIRTHVKQALAGTASSLVATQNSNGGAALGLLPWPNVDFSKFGRIEPTPLSRIKKISGANLHRNWVMIPHVTNNDVADITELEALRLVLNKENERSGIKITMLTFLIKAVVASLKKFPEFNASLDGDNLVYKHYYHVGFAADTKNGLVVPVIRDADKKGILALAKDSSVLANKARDGKLVPAEMQGGCFSISSLGGIGGTSFTPIINAPEVAILGVSRASYQPVWDGKQFVPRLQLPLSLSYDHRVIDGAAAARFNAYLGTLLADFRRIAL